MLLSCFAIKDIKADSFLQVMYFRRVEEALRSFGNVCNNIQSDFYRYAEDYALYELGTYDDELGVHVSFDTPIFLQSASTASTYHRDFYAARSTLDQGNHSSSGESLSDTIDRS